MINGKINDTTVSTHTKPTLVSKDGNGLILIRQGESLLEVFLDGQGLSDGNTSSGILVVIESERELIIRERFGKIKGVTGQSGAGTKLKVVKAPMPGMVKSVFVSVGSIVTKDTQILILEAMKMENSIAAGANGIVKKVTAQAGNSIEKNATICEIEIGE